MSDALVLLGHADPKSFNAALANAYHDAVRAAGLSSTLVTLSDLSFDPVLRHGFRPGQSLEPDLEKLRARFEEARHVAWFFPTYWASPPAIVRAVVDRLFLPGWAFRYEGGALPVGLMRGRSSRVVTTMDSPSWWYALAHHRAIHGAFTAGTLRFVGFAPVRTYPIYTVRTSRPVDRAKELTKMTNLARSDMTKLPARTLPKAALEDVAPRTLSPQSTPRNMHVTSDETSI